MRHASVLYDSLVEYEKQERLQTDTLKRKQYYATSLLRIG